MAATAILLLTFVAAQGTSHDSHGYDDTSHESLEGEPFEAAAVYDVEAGTGSFAVIPAAGSFEEETFAFMIVPAASADLDGLEEAGEEAAAGKSEHLALKYCSVNAKDGIRQSNNVHMLRTVHQTMLSRDAAPLTAPQLYEP